MIIVKHPKHKKISFIACSVLVSISITGGITIAATSNYRTYKAGMKLFESGRFMEARDIFVGLGDYKDSPEKVRDSVYGYAKSALSNLY